MNPALSNSEMKLHGLKTTVLPCWIRSRIRKGGVKLLVEGGATKTEAFLVDSKRKIISRYKTGPTNLHVVGIDGVYKNLKKILEYFKQKPVEYHFYLSGLKTEKDKRLIRQICKRLGLKGKIVLGCDLSGGLLRKSDDGTGIIAVSGTGSAVYGRNKEGKEIQVGGWGDRIGDEAGAYNIAISGLKAAIRSYDGRGPNTILEKKFGKIENFTDWIDKKNKTQIAKLAPIVFKAAERGDRVAEKIIDNAVDNLIESLKVVREKIGEQKIYLSGGNFEFQPLFRQKFVQKLDMEMFEAAPRTSPPYVEEVVAGQREKIFRVIEKTADAFRNGGRLIYVGAGTSGRIAMIDAVECRPTFNVPRSMVQAIIAGGNRALTRAVEGAEDNFSAGRKAIRDKKVNKKDIVIGVTASGTTPFVAGALREAERRGAYTALVTSGNNGTADSVIRLDTGHEIIEGSTRLNAGTAAKMVLNMISTNSMIKLGKTFDKYMIDVRPTSEKLKKRAVGIISEICGLSEKDSLQLLKEAGYNTRNAVREGLSNRIGDLLMFGFNKDKAPKDAGSIIVFDRNVKYLKKLKKYFIAVDQEGGRVNRIRKGVTILPAPGKIKTVKEAYGCGKVLAKELISLGIKLNLAPVVDVNTEPANSIIGDRSFGDNPKKVSRFACAMLRGMQDNGLLACAKHFPGHGATKRDSHKCLSKVNVSYKEWERVHLPPFISAIKAGVSSIMAGHLLYPALDEKYPSSLSQKIITGILREKLGFNGVVITDDIGMGAIARHYSPEEAAVLALNAGVDIVLVCKGRMIQERVMNAIVDGILDGRIKMDRINQSIERVRKLKKGVL